jgi:glycosyltransferase involved in cell wall biosynthesis
MATAVHTDDALPLVSIALCTYNGEKFLRTQLDSLLDQTYRNIEVIAVDDTSSDSTVGILKEYAAKDSRLKFFVNEKNLGYNKNFEKACQLTSGDLIATSDQDDIWDLDKIETMITQWDRKSLLLYSWSREFWGNEPEMGEENKPIVYYEGSMPEKIPFDSHIHGHGLIFQRSLLIASIPFPPAVFYDLWLGLIASATGSVQCIRKTLTRHRRWTSNSSRVLTSISEKAERTQKLRDQCAHHIEEFLALPFAGKQTRTILGKYASLLRAKKNNDFSWSFFIFFLKYRDITFHYKRHRNIFSITKNSFRRAFIGL